jgi:prepilin-type N-terminal cleavage/methylation domain-containing protein
MERKGKYRNGGGGFTLIELILVSAILSVLAAIALPKFGDLIAKAREASAKGNLGEIRGAIRIEELSRGYDPGTFPLSGAGLNFSCPLILEPHFGNLLPIVYFKHLGHRQGNGRGSNVGTPPYEDFYEAVTITARANYWVWYHSSSILFIGCTHRDLSGRIWSTW